VIKASVTAYWQSNKKKFSACCTKKIFSPVHSFASGFFVFGGGTGNGIWNGRVDCVPAWHDGLRGFHGVIE
jgi:hypothetical protein